MIPAGRLRCGGCGWESEPGAIAFRCPRWGTDGADHVLVPQLDPGVPWPAPDGEPNPFVHYRRLLHAYAHWRAGGGSDAGWVDRVGELDRRVAAVTGTGFRMTPLLTGDGVMAKDETGNIGGSHKARHLFGALLALPEDGSPLAIASCGNAALAAAIVARAADRALRVFVPVWADATVVEELGELGAEVIPSPREEGEEGDPAVLRFREDVVRGSVPFSCQGTDNALALDGGRTLGWELADQLGPAGAGRVVVQVGGGALASSVFRALEEAVRLGRLAGVPELVAVQAEGAAPLARAWARLVPRADGEGWARALREAAGDRRSVMWPWEQPLSMATGILDDESYDWLEIVRAVAGSGGTVITVTEESLAAATREAGAWVPTGVGPTGAAGLAGARTLPPSATGPTVVLFTGRS